MFRLRPPMTARGLILKSACRQQSTSASEAPKRKASFGKIVGRAAGAGMLVVAGLQLYHLNNPTEEERLFNPATVFARLPGDKTPLEERMASETQYMGLSVIPYRGISRLWGFVNDIELPMWAREPVYKAWTYAFDCQLHEMKYPLKEYRNLGEFFSRPLKEGARVVDRDPRVMSSPVDGRMATIGVVDGSQGIPVLEQIKVFVDPRPGLTVSQGARYRMDEFLGSIPDFFSEKTPGKRLYHCVIYLAPGDYHRIHSPIDWSVEERRHFPGNLFPVNSLAVNFVPSLFTANERIALLGQWKHGFYSLTAVGATNVGSIGISLEPELVTNLGSQDRLGGTCLAKVYEAQHLVSRGDQVAEFKLGSTVVLVFEAPEDFEFSVQPGEKIRYGQPIGRFTKEATPEGPSTFPSTAELIKHAPPSRSYFGEVSHLLGKVFGSALQETTEKALTSDKIADSRESLGPAYTKE
ncbi:phosphatidylserine decarboxylase [Achlya hypogyna]|uniref:Phosphatidylserine decarboxylase proenzyme, mitochondrial n=1 Tax=Achlya hypogyna TaxID=1202772 RepID=A0A1V9YDF9_ACHHY|nr:phosphatidylserine decarboxylase [Achlya hypogyna]